MDSIVTQFANSCFAPKVDFDKNIFKTLQFLATLYMSSTKIRPNLEPLFLKLFRYHQETIFSPFGYSFQEFSNLDLKNMYSSEKSSSRFLCKFAHSIFPANSSLAMTAVGSSNDFTLRSTNDNSSSAERAFFSASTRKLQDYYTAGKNSPTAFFSAEASFRKPLLKATIASSSTTAFLSLAVSVQSIEAFFSMYGMV